jgi:signal transduction histidine kinase
VFKRYPYKGWMLLALLLWGLAIARYYQARRSVTPASMAHTMERDLQKKEDDCSLLLNDRELLDRIFSGTLSAYDVERLVSQSFGLYAYRNDTIIFWNNNKLLADCEHPVAPIGEQGLYYHERGKFVKACIEPDTSRSYENIVVLYPIITTYPFENNYLHSSFDAAEYIPLNTVVSPRKSPNSFPIVNRAGKTVFHVQFNPETLPEWPPGIALLGLIFAALLFSIFWFQLITTYYTRNKSFWHGFLLLAAVLSIFRMLTYWLGLPFNLDVLPLFRPQLYASSAVLSSLGQLLLNALLFLWLIIFILRHARHDILAEYKMSPAIRILLALLVTIGFFLYSFGYINIISSLITDSNISFDVSHFYTISTYTITGLFIVAIITVASFMVGYLLSIQLRILVSNNWLKYAMMSLVGFIMIWVSDTVTPPYVSYLLLLWLVVFIMLMDIKQLQPGADLYSPQMIFWCAFVFMFSTGILQYFNYVKERDARLAFAEKALQQRDDVTEFTFRAIAENIAEDPVLKSFITRPEKNGRKEIDERFDALYLGGHMNKYQSRLLIFDRMGRNLYNNDTLSYNTLIAQVRSSEPTLTRYLYYRENAQDGRYYLAQVPVAKADTGKSEILGYVFIDMAVKEATGETVYPELLQPGTVVGSRNEEGYSYAVYVNNRLLTQTTDYDFPIYITDTIPEEYRFTEHTGSSELRYRQGERTVFVIRYHRLWLESITLFSYLFGMQMILSLISVVYRIYLLFVLRSGKQEKLVNFTLRRRIHISFLGIVFISFIIIGLITILFFTVQYKQNSRRKQQLVMQLVERATLQYLKENKADNGNNEYNRLVASTAFRYFITSLSNAQKIDINIYHASGVLIVTSQEDIYDRNLFARIIPPDAYYELSERGNQFLIQDEHIGKLSYVSCYKPIRNKEGLTLGYINVPFFSSEKELNFQISSILVGLINLYAFVFLFSGVLTVFITRWITKSLSIVIKSFSRFSLSKNEPVSWPYEDEIGLLVNEYNKMVKKAEENARLLAQSEREGAWREMAQQVAHEIKNPLTPMKLNIQYLQQALSNNYPNVNELAKKVSESLIEQINNLSYIASEFSDFAKMPEARPEKFDLNELLQRTVDLYKNQSEVTVSFKPFAAKLAVYTDKSQLLRVFNNLLENAVQAIPAEREGRVEVSLSKEGDDALIAFTDNGTGIEGEAVGRIFQPYFTTKTSGTGLGLAMTKKIIEFWKGTIRFETQPGKGTTFYITVPLANGDAV